MNYKLQKQSIQNTVASQNYFGNNFFSLFEPIATIRYASRDSRFSVFAREDQPLRLPQRFLRLIMIHRDDETIFLEIPTYRPLVFTVGS